MTVLDWLVNLGNDAIVLAQKIFDFLNTPLRELLYLWEGVPIMGTIWKFHIDVWWSIFEFLFDMPNPTLTDVLVGIGLPIILITAIVKWIIGIVT